VVTGFFATAARIRRQDSGTRTRTNRVYVTCSISAYVFYRYFVLFCRRVNLYRKQLRPVIRRARAVCSFWTKRKPPRNRDVRYRARSRVNAVEALWRDTIFVTDRGKRSRSEYCPVCGSVRKEMDGNNGARRRNASTNGRVIKTCRFYSGKPLTLTTITRYGEAGRWPILKVTIPFSSGQRVRFFRKLTRTFVIITNFEPVCLFGESTFLRN